jgi:uncharacterized protein (TIGR03435 family)
MEHDAAVLKWVLAGWRIIIAMQAEMMSRKAVALSLLIALFGPQPIQCQTITRPQFEAASIKPVPGSMDSAYGTLPGRLSIVNGRLPIIIMEAYGLKQSFQLVGGPAWIRSARYDIQAKAQGVPAPDQLMLMLQDLLEDRFKLKVHRETRELPVFLLTLAKGGPKEFKAGTCVLPDPIKPTVESGPYCGRNQLLRGRWDGSNIDLTKVVDGLSVLLDRKIIDKTGLTGLFDIHLELPPDSPSVDDAAPSLNTVLQEQLGLKLESGKGPVEIIVIDHIERPTEN